MIWLCKRTDASRSGASRRDRAGALLSTGAEPVRFEGGGIAAAVGYDIRDRLDLLPFRVASMVRPALLGGDDAAIKSAIAEVQTCRDEFAGVAESTVRLIERYDTAEGRVGREDIIAAFRQSAKVCESVAVAAEAVLESLNARSLR